MNPIWFPRVRTDNNLGSSMFSATSSYRDTHDRIPRAASGNRLEQQDMSIFLNVDPPPSSINTNNPALRPAKGVNPQATLVGLPSELRLEIYDHLYPSRLTHVTTTGGARGLGTICTGILKRPDPYRFLFASTENAPLRLFWRPCMCPSPSLDTCAKPPWSGLAIPQEHCSTANCSTRYDFNIAATNKALRKEVLHYVLARVSMPLDTAYAIFQSHTSDILDHIQHLTLTPEILYSWSGCELDPSLLRTYQLITSRSLPSLQSVTFQTRMSTKAFRTVPINVKASHGYESPERLTTHRNWLLIWRYRTFNDDRLPRSFPVSVTAEFWSVLTPQDQVLGLGNDSRGVEMLCIRKHIPRFEVIKNTIKGTGTDDLEISMQKIQKRKSARWKSFWLSNVDGLGNDLVLNRW